MDICGAMPFSESVGYEYGLGFQLSFIGNNDGIAEKLLGEMLHHIGAFLHNGQVTRLLFGIVGLLDHIKIAAYGSQGSPQVVGDIGDGAFQLSVALYVGKLLGAHGRELSAEALGEPADILVTAGDIDEVIGVIFKSVSKLRGYLPCRLFQQIYLDA